MNVSMTDLKRKANFKQLTRWLAKHNFITVTHDGDPVCELHPVGTADRLAELEAGK